MSGDWLKDFVKAWNEHDVDGLTAFMTDDVVYWDMGIGWEVKGHEGVKELARITEEDFSSDYRMECVSTFQDGDLYAAEWDFSGTHDRGTDALPATGKRYNVRGVSVGKLENGKIKVNRDYYSLLVVMQQLGVLPALPGAEQPSPA